MTETYLDCLRKKYNIESDRIDLQAIFKKYKEIDPNDDSIDPDDPDKRVLLHILIEDEREEEIAFILKESAIKADPNVIDTKLGVTPICAALQTCQFSVVKMLVEAGADVNLPSDSMTPVQLAAS